MDTLLKDVRYAVVTMARNRGFAAAGLLTLALGIGATTAVFSVVYGVLLRPLPYPAADRLVRLSEEHPGAASPLRMPMLSNLTYYAWSQSPRTPVHRLAARRPGADRRHPGHPITLRAHRRGAGAWPVLSAG